MRVLFPPILAVFPTSTTHAPFGPVAMASRFLFAVGVTVDSYVVFFERLKDEVRAGRWRLGLAVVSPNPAVRQLGEARDVLADEDAVHRRRRPGARRRRRRMPSR